MGSAKDTHEGIKLLKQASAQGHLKSQLVLANIFELGEYGIKQDYAEACRQHCNSKPCQTASPTEYNERLTFSFYITLCGAPPGLVFP